MTEKNGRASKREGESEAVMNTGGVKTELSSGTWWLIFSPTNAFSAADLRQIRSYKSDDC